jgi:hypothetical protein
MVLRRTLWADMADPAISEIFLKDMAYSVVDAGGGAGGLDGVLTGH